MSLVFVYGTLKRGCSNHHHLAGQTFVGLARTRPGFWLFDVGGFPGLVAHPTDADGVAGEVWLVDPGCLERLDELEGVAEGLYRRAGIPLESPFAESAVEAYLYPHSIAGRTELGSSWNG